MEDHTGHLPHEAETMILWTIKLISSVRKAIAGRKHPSQLAWAVAFGFLLGVIPHGNLLAVALLLVVLTLQVNHAMAALVGIGVTFVAPRMDPTFDQLGRWFFEQPRVAEALATAWQYPLVPWTDLNNTVVMGSFLIGLIALVPLFLVTYPLFRSWSVVGADADEETLIVSAKSKRKAKSGKASNGANVHRIDAAHEHTSNSNTAAERDAQPDTDAPREPTTHPHHQPVAMQATSGRVYDVRRVDAVADVTPPVKPPAAPNSAPRKTRVGISASGPVKRPAGSAAVTPRPQPSSTTVDPHGSTLDDQHKIDEALSYLLRQLRDSQDKDAA